ncbi:hypothetical protein BDR06DRAFT_971978 [Suillus hirtellus]|nr:hypothetical protein BDR06DRAFT_971978 [Suillus hirtellus]
MKKSNCMSLVLMEALQMIKFLLKKERLDFTKGWATSQKDMQYKILSEGDETNNLLTFSSSKIMGDTGIGLGSNFPLVSELILMILRSTVTAASVLVLVCRQGQSCRNHWPKCHCDYNHIATATVGMELGAGRDEVMEIINRGKVMEITSKLVPVFRCRPKCHRN